MKTSYKAIDLIKHFEGCRLKPYKDAVGLWTVGYGHLIGDGTTLPSALNKTFTQTEVDGFLMQDIGIMERAINNCLKVELNQNQFDACVCWTFNLGVEEFKKYIAPMINGGDTAEEIVAEMIKFNHAKGKVLEGLTERRLAEKDLFLED